MNKNKLIISKQTVNRQPTVNFKFRNSYLFLSSFLETCSIKKKYNYKKLI